ncbi:MAG: DUF308 domain-containing protein [Thermomicrobiales bacterium]|nr:DUF308 domain-containing protein [Thermomicrobiales bacterium]
MIEAVTSRWWLFLAQGVAMLILAAIGFTNPGVIIQILGAYFVIDGALKLVGAFTNKKDDPSRLMNIITGVIGVLVGLYAFMNPAGAALVITYAIAIWVIILGIMLVIWGVQLREQFTEYWLLIVLGVLSVIFGLLVFNNVLAGFLTFASLFVAYMIIGGVLAIVLGFRIKALGERLGLLTS